MDKDTKKVDRVATNIADTVALHELTNVLTSIDLNQLSFRLRCVVIRLSDILLKYIEEDTDICRKEQPNEKKGVANNDN